MAITGFWRGEPGSGGGGEYDDTEIRGRLTDVENELTGAEAAIAANAAAIDDLPGPYDDTALAGRVSALENAPDQSWDDITDKPAEFVPAAHSHAIGDVTGLQAELDAKQPATAFKTVNGENITGSGDIVVPAGNDGESVTITTFTDQTAYDAYSPAALEIAVLTES